MSPRKQTPLLWEESRAAAQGPSLVIFCPDVFLPPHVLISGTLIPMMPGPRCSVCVCAFDTCPAQMHVITPRSPSWLLLAAAAALTVEDTWLSTPSLQQGAPSAAHRTGHPLSSPFPGASVFLYPFYAGLAHFSDFCVPWLQL